MTDIAAIVEMKTRNPNFGYFRIAQQISHVFGIAIDKDVVRRVLSQHYRPNDTDANGPSWLSFLAQTKDSLWSLDLFRCESILPRSHWVLVVMDVFTRRVIGFGVERAYIDGVSVRRMFNHAISGDPPPKRVSTDHDPLFRFHRWLANLRVPEIEEIKAVLWSAITPVLHDSVIPTTTTAEPPAPLQANIRDASRPAPISQPRVHPPPIDVGTRTADIPPVLAADGPSAL